MSNLKYSWKYGENEHQKYYDVYIGKDYLCVWQNKWEPDIWMGMSRDKMIHNKTKNNKYRRKENFLEYTLERTAMTLFFVVLILFI